MKVTNEIHTSCSAGITQLKNDPMGVMEEAGDRPVVILNRNKPAFYVVSCELFHALVKKHNAENHRGNEDHDKP